MAEAGAGDEEQQRLIAIYQGIVLAAARRVLRPHGAGEVEYVLSRYEGGTLIVRPLRDGYYVTIVLRPGSDVALGLHRSAAARARMDEAM